MKSLLLFVALSAVAATTSTGDSTFGTVAAPQRIGDVNYTNGQFAGFVPGSAGAALRNSIEALLAGKTNTITQWAYGDTFSRNPRCWCGKLDFSGFVTPTSPSEQERCMVLVTPRHAITCAHAFGDNSGKRVIFVQTNGSLFTNWVASATCQPGEDICLVTLSNPCPASVTPFPVMPPNWTNKISTPTRIPVIWYRCNSRKMNCEKVSSVSGTQITCNGDYGSPFYEPGATGGDSGGPCFMVLNGKLIFIMSLHWGSVAGPFISQPDNFNWVSAQVAPYKLTTVDLSGYPDF